MIDAGVSSQLSYSPVGTGYWIKYKLRISISVYYELKNVYSELNTVDAFWKKIICKARVVINVLGEYVKNKHFEMYYRSNVSYSKFKFR